MSDLPLGVSHRLNNTRLKAIKLFDWVSEIRFDSFEFFPFSSKYTLAVGNWLHSHFSARFNIGESVCIIPGVSINRHWLKFARRCLQADIGNWAVLSEDWGHQSPPVIDNFLAASILSGSSWAHTGTDPAMARWRWRLLFFLPRHLLTPPVPLLASHELVISQKTFPAFVITHRKVLPYDSWKPFK